VAARVVEAEVVAATVAGLTTGGVGCGGGGGGGGGEGGFTAAAAGAAGCGGGNAGLTAVFDGALGEMPLGPLPVPPGCGGGGGGGGGLMAAFDGGDCEPRGAQRVGDETGIARLLCWPSNKTTTTASHNDDAHEVSHHESPHSIV
jgi:hypothetical protein